MNIVVNLNKPKGISSQDAVTKTKKIFKVRKAGHTGTLDPLATGVMLVCLNEATKIASLVESLEKEYVVTAKLGEKTETFDSEGKVIKSADYAGIGSNEINALLPGFSGEIEQMPPMYSAIKVSGKPLYKLARKGIEVERKPRKVFISEIELLDFAPPFFKLRIVCSKGTYVRSICNDLGDALGVGAHMTDLVRTRVGNFSIGNSAILEELPQKAAALHSIDLVLQHLPELRIEGEYLRKAKNGNQLPAFLLPDFEKFKASAVRLKDNDGKLFGIGKVSNESIKIERLLLL